MKLEITLSPETAKLIAAQLVQALKGVGDAASVKAAAADEPEADKPKRRTRRTTTSSKSKKKEPEPDDDDDGDEDLSDLLGEDDEDDDAEALTEDDVRAAVVAFVKSEGKTVGHVRKIFGKYDAKTPADLDPKDYAAVVKALEV